MQIIKKDYSSNPWRLVDSEGREIEAPGMDIVTNERGAKWAIKKNIWGQTKRECTENALALLELMLYRAAGDSGTVAHEFTCQITNERR